MLPRAPQKLGRLARRLGARRRTPPLLAGAGARGFAGASPDSLFELAWAAAYSFAGAPPRFLETDQVDFRRPVGVGALLSLRAKVLGCVDARELAPEIADAFAQASACGEGLAAVVTVDVTAVVSDPAARASAVSNTFSLRFGVDSSAGDAGDRPERAGLRRVLPGNAEEATGIARHHMALTQAAA